MNVLLFYFPEQKNNKSMSITTMSQNKIKGKKKWFLVFLLTFMVCQNECRKLNKLDEMKRAF